MYSDCGREIERLQDELERAKANHVSAQQEETEGRKDLDLLKKRANQKLSKDMVDWPRFSTLLFCSLELFFSVPTLHARGGGLIMHVCFMKHG